MTYDPTQPPPDPQQGAAPAPDQYQAQYPPAPAPDQYQAQYPPATYGAPQGYSMPPGYQMPQPTVQAKNPAISLLLSFFIPGLGSMVSGNVGIGVLILCLYVLGIVLTIFLIGFLLMLGMWIWGMVDAYQSAVKWNQAHGIIS